MAKTAAFRSMLAVAGVAIALGAAGSALAQATPHTPQVKFIPVGQAPQPPAGLKVTCVKAPDDGASPSDTCPVIYFGANKTWVYSYLDNRVSFALVTYDETGKVLQNIEKPGARYIFDVFSSDRGQQFVLIGQAKGSVMVNWSELPH